MKKFTYGGQAIIEGVMIRGETCYSIAIRTPTGSIITKSFNLNSFLNGSARKIPMLRGVLTLIEMLFIGTKSLSYSAEIASKEIDNPESPKESGTDISLIITMIFSLIFGITLFFLIPLYISSLFENFLHLHVISNIFEGFVRIIIFLVYLILIGQIHDIKRVFMYHGAEHMAIHCYEKNETLSVDNIKKYSTQHPRCGTAFILVVLILSIIIFGIIGRDFSPAVLIASRIFMIPIIAAIGYEIIRISGKFQNQPIIKMLFKPSLELQKLTTKIPDDEQIEIAISSLNLAIEKDHNQKNQQL